MQHESHSALDLKTDDELIELNRHGDKTVIGLTGQPDIVSSQNAIVQRAMTPVIGASSFSQDDNFNKDLMRPSSLMMDQDLGNQSALQPSQKLGNQICNNKWENLANVLPS